MAGVAGADDVGGAEYVNEDDGEALADARLPDARALADDALASGCGMDTVGDGLKIAGCCADGDPLVHAATPADRKTVRAAARTTVDVPAARMGRSARLAPAARVARAFVRNGVVSI